MNSIAFLSTDFVSPVGTFVISNNLFEKGKPFQLKIQIGTKDKILKGFKTRTEALTAIKEQKTTFQAWESLSRKQALLYLEHGWNQHKIIPCERTLS